MWSPGALLTPSGPVCSPGLEGPVFGVVCGVSGRLGWGLGVSCSLRPCAWAELGETYICGQTFVFCAPFPYCSDGCIFVGGGPPIWGVCPETPSGCQRAKMEPDRVWAVCSFHFCTHTPVRPCVECCLRLSTADASGGGKWSCDHSTSTDSHGGLSASLLLGAQRSRAGSRAHPHLKRDGTRFRYVFLNRS